MTFRWSHISMLVVATLLAAGCGASEPRGGAVRAGDYTLEVTAEAARLAAPYDLLAELPAVLETFRSLPGRGGPVLISGEREFPDGPGAERGLGVGGHTDDRGVHLVIAPAATTELLRQHLPGLLAHEAHHWARRTSSLDRAETLAEKLVTESLANRYVVEMGHEVRREAVALTCEELQQEWERAVPVLHDEGVALHAWLFGGADREGQIHPDFTGYALGYQLAGAYLDASGLTAARAAIVDPREVIERSGYSGGCFDEL